MDCKITSIKRAARAAFTLVELAVASGVSIVVVGMLLMLYIYFLKSFAGLENHMNMNHRSRLVLGQVSKEIRQADSLLSYTTNTLTFKLATNTVSFTYDPTGRTFTRTSGGSRKVLLTGCDYMKYDIYQRSPTNGSYDLFPTAVATNCKVVQLTWICSRAILGRKINTEDVQSAKVVIRKQKT